ncbi:hypothetical protein [Natrarchaeobius chitinivorans]|uniref:hypothetical protein n=1 Tax=Natrarchaeobius chitinivorans TaxID=1679083 RepID=UPI001FB40245|nr:hypothetical protein [Natrarchaeobius chitinivorans]
MSDNPFDDLESGGAGETTTDSGVSETATSGTTADSSAPEPAANEPTDHSTPSTNSAEPSNGEQTQPDETASPADAGPAFEYSEVRQKPLYARGETWDELEDQLGITVTPELRRMGIRDEETREVHDALLKVVLEHIDEVPDRIRDTRVETE